MIITWAISSQHTEWGLFKVGDVIDTTEKGIPDSVVESWTRDGFATVPVTIDLDPQGVVQKISRPGPVNLEKPRKAKKASEEE